jgi:putative peptidoglycan lipid II flippase
MRDFPGEATSGESPLPSAATTSSDDELSSAAGTARDSSYVAAGTALARVTGVVRVVGVGAVLGPSYLGNAYLVTNALPNLIYYGFLAGSLVPTLLVPMLVRHLDAGRPEAAARVTGGVLGLVFTMTVLLVPVAVVGLPALMAAAAHATGASTSGQAGLARWLVVMTVPQVFLYAVAGTGMATLFAHRRFVLGSVAPAVENVLVVCVLGLVAARYGLHRADADGVPTGELLLLGLGSTAAVGGHAALQWWGARRCGVVLRPTRGWREPEVRAVLRRAKHALAQAGLLAVQTLALLVVASTVAGGVVALQIALNFYFLPIALIATPVGLALLPRLARLHRSGGEGFADTFVRGLTLALFFATPASVGYVAVAGPVAHTIGVGELTSEKGYAMVAGALAALAVGLVGQTVFFISTQASYAAGDTRAPLQSMTLQAAVCLLLCTTALAVADAARLPMFVGGAYATASLVGGGHLLHHVAHGSAAVLRPLGASLARALVCSLAMVLPVRIVLAEAHDAAPGRVGWVLALVSGCVIGALVYLLVHLLLRSGELRWLRASLRRTASATPRNGSS